MALRFFDSVGLATEDGLFIPITDLPGITSTELAAGEPSNKKHSKFLFSLLDKLVSNYNSQHLGFVINKLRPTISGNFVNQTYTILTQLVVDIINNELVPIPVPVSGDNLGIGDFSLSVYLPNSVMVLSTDNVSGAGVLVPLADLELHGHNAGVLGTDDRKTLFALISLITYSNDFKLRSTSPIENSAIISKENGVISLVELPTSAYSTTNPTTGLLLENKNRQFILQREYLYTIQLSLAATSTEINYA